MEKFLSLIGSTLYTFRSVMSIFYIGLTLLILAIVYKFMAELIHVPAMVFDPSTKKIDLVIKSLEMVDLVMIGQLVWVVAMAGISLFVTTRHFEENPDLKKPDWLDHVNTYNLKLKLAFAMISISGVHALKVYLSSSTSTETLVITVSAHFVFVLSAIGIAYAERVTKTDVH